jgi:outer membrane lipoprotein-sorting protein
LINACSLRFLKIENPREIAKYLAQIESYNQRVYGLRAALDIKAQGVLAGFIHEQADILIEEPKYLYWSLRSFFGSPSVLIASNGNFVTMLDFSGQSEMTYQKIPIKNDTFFQLFDFPFYPTSVIELLLAKVSLKTAKFINFNIAKDKLEIKAELNDFWGMESIFDHRANRLLETKLTNEAESVFYHIKYENFKNVSGIYFPQSLVLLVKSKSRFARFHIELKEIELNGEPVAKDIFYLEQLE